MSKRESISRYSLIIKKLRSKPSSFQEIADYLEFQSEFQGYDFNISKRTFHRDKNDILSLYNIEILYNSAEKVYYIDDESSEFNDRILEAFDVFNALNFIHFENRKPKGTGHLNTILQAIKSKNLIQFDYQKFWDEEPSCRIVEPLALKEFKNRWYLISKDTKDNKIKTFGLDRLSQLIILRKSFSYPENFEINKYFKNCFGIIGPNAKEPSEIILSFTPLQGKYIKTLPLHESQEIITDTDTEFRIKLKLFITEDFIMELLTHGETLKVIQPQTLAKKVKGKLEKALQSYTKADFLNQRR